MFKIIYLLLIQSVLSAENIFATEKFFPSDAQVFFDNRADRIARIENVPNINKPVRRFLKSYNSLRPVALLVDDSNESVSSATEFVKDIFKLAPKAKLINFYVSKFNSTGMTKLAEITGDEPEKIYQIFSSQIQKETSELGHKKPTGTLAFYATLSAASALPQNTAIIIFIDRKISDEDLAAHTSILRKKNIKVYVVWSGLYPSKTNEESLLEELCTYSGGLFLINGIKDLSTYNYKEFINNHTHTNMSTILKKSNLPFDSNYTFPIDSEITCIHLILTPSTTEATLTTPSGEHFNVNDSDSIASYGKGSFGVMEEGQREVYLKITQDGSVGLWHLNVKVDTFSRSYNVTLFVCTGLTAQAYFISKNEGNNVDKRKKKILKLDFMGGLNSVNNITFLNSKGQMLEKEIKYDVKKDFLIMETGKHNKAINIEIDNIPEKPFQVLIQGTDIKGNRFSRLTNLNFQSSNNIFPQPILSIDVGIGSELLTTGGRTSTITFEVTNLKNTAADVSFYCKDEKSILGSMQPYRKIISPQETAIVILNLVSKYGVYQDLITFIASLGSENIEKKVIVDVGTQSQSIGDNTPPSLDYTYLGDCSKVIFSSCDQGTWTIEAKAKDTGTGLLQLTSIPKGMYFQEGFTTGTKEEVTGSYSGSCCNADLQLIAIDRANNRRTVTINAYRAMWGPGQIAALVLGIILLILLIVLIVYLIRKCIKKREKYNLPVYRGRGI